MAKKPATRKPKAPKIEWRKDPTNEKQWVSINPPGYLVEFTPKGRKYNVYFQTAKINTRQISGLGHALDACNKHFKNQSKITKKETPAEAPKSETPTQPPVVAPLVVGEPTQPEPKVTLPPSPTPTGGFISAVVGSVDEETPGDEEDTPISPEPQEATKEVAKPTF